MNDKSQSTPEKKQLDSLTENLRMRFSLWQDVYHNGTNNPFSPDGMNLNATRNCIINFKKLIKALCDESGLPLPQEYFKETPQKVDRNFTARKEEIRINAVKTLPLFKKNRDYQYLVRENSKVDEDTRKDSNIDNVLSYVSRLETAIKQNDYLIMRLYENRDRYFKSFTSCAEAVHTAIESVTDSYWVRTDNCVQLSLFD